MNQPTHRRAGGRIPVHQRVINAVKTAATATVTVLRSIAEMFVPSMQPSFAGMTTSADNATYRTDHDTGGFAGTKNMLTTALAHVRGRAANDIGTTGIHANTMHAGQQVNQRRDGTLGTGLDPSATSAVLQT